MEEEIELKRKRDNVVAIVEAQDYEEVIIHNNLFSLVRNAHHEEINAALTKGCDSNLMDDDGNTLLIVAAQNNQFEIVKLLLKFGASIEMFNVNGNSALHFCSEYGYHMLGRYLLLQKANPFIKNLKGLFAYQGSNTIHSTLEDYGLTNKSIKEMRQFFKMDETKKDY